MAEQRPRKVDLDIVLRMQSVGIKAGNLNYNNIPSKYRNSLDSAPDRAQKSMKNRVATMGRKVNGWSLIEKEAMGVYGIDYLQRAAVAMFGLGANPKADAIYPQLHVDSKEESLTVAISTSFILKRVSYHRQLLFGQSLYTIVKALPYQTNTTRQLFQVGCL